MSENTNARDWTWTPTPGMNRTVATILKLPLVHNIMSSHFMLLTFTGRKSGKQYTTPVGYFRDGDTIRLTCKRFRKWWHNFEEPAQVEMRIKGKNVTGTATAISDPELVAPLLTQRMESNKRDADIYGIRIIDGKANPDDIREKSEMIIVIEIVPS